MNKHSHTCLSIYVYMCIFQASKLLHFDLFVCFYVCMYPNDCFVTNRVKLHYTSKYLHMYVYPILYLPDCSAERLFVYLLFCQTYFFLSAAFNANKLRSHRRLLAVLKMKIMSILFYCCCKFYCWHTNNAYTY